MVVAYWMNGKCESINYNVVLNVMERFGNHPGERNNDKVVFRALIINF